MSQINGVNCRVMYMEYKKVEIVKIKNHQNEYFGGIKI